MCIYTYIQLIPIIGFPRLSIRLRLRASLDVANRVRLFRQMVVNRNPAIGSIDADLSTLL